MLSKSLSAGFVLMFVSAALMGCSTEDEMPDPLASGTADARQVFARAISSGDEGLVAEMLAAEPALAVSANPLNNVPPLLVAAAHGNANIVRMLLDKGADINAMNDEGERAVDVARAQGAGQEVLSLLGGGQ